jgi:hypothetical protein
MQNRAMAKVEGFPHACGRLLAFLINWTWEREENSLFDAERSVLPFHPIHCESLRL